jgi:hypothetical protein
MHGGQSAFIARVRTTLGPYCSGSCTNSAFENSGSVE